MKNKGIIFDLDGTLWNSSDNVVISWNKVFASHKEFNLQITDRDMQGLMGLTMENIIKALLPELDEKDRLKVLEECCEVENNYLAEHGGVLFPDLEDTLKKLSEKYRLFIVSNCQSGYIECFMKYYGFEKYFTDFECSGNTGEHKGKNVQSVIKRNNLSAAVYVGDAQVDLDAARFANIPFIYCKYGFGHVDEEKIVINCLPELVDTVEKVI
jgi:phosphoglycolate phosphatase